MVERSPLSCWESGKPPGTFRLCCQDCHGICQGDWINLPKEAQDHWHWRRIIHEVHWQRKKDYHSHFNVEILTFIVHNSYTDASEPKGFEFQTYRQQLQEAAPDLFSGRYRVRSAHFFHFLDLQKLGWNARLFIFLQIVTEFGRSLMLKAGKTLTRIETIKKWLPEVQPIILTHVGSNQVSILAHFQRKARENLPQMEPVVGWKSAQNQLFITF